MQCNQQLGNLALIEKTNDIIFALPDCQLIFVLYFSNSKYEGLSDLLGDTYIYCECKRQFCQGTHNIL